jgi:hypothetical protein
MRRSVLLAVALVSTACSADGSPADPGDAAVDAPACMRADPSCPAVVPSYSASVRGIIETACVDCHYPGSGMSNVSPLVTYDEVYASSGASLGQVSACLMPRPPEPNMPEAARATLLAWLACGAPDN